MDLRVRRLGDHEGLLAAALHLQSLHARGIAAQPGHLDRYAESWSAAGDLLPQWVAESDGEHRGTLLLRAPVSLPPHIDPAQTVGEVVLLYVVSPLPGQVHQVQVGLLQAARRWSGEHSLEAIHLGAQLELMPSVRDDLQVTPAVQGATGHLMSCSRLDPGAP